MVLTAVQDSSFPDILLVYGDDFLSTSKYREILKTFLHSPNANTSPVHLNTHDFWITYMIGLRDGANHSFSDPIPTLNPPAHPMRGIVQMEDDVSPKWTGTIRNTSLLANVATVLHEILHHWLVYREDFLIQGLNFWPSPAGPCQLLGSDIATLSLNQGIPFCAPQLVGRDNNHWSTFMQGDASAMDGMFWNETSSVDGYQEWHQDRQYLVSLPSIHVGESYNPTIRLTLKYSDLDLYVMGVRPRQEVLHNQFKWLEPRLTVPLSYHAGLFVAFSQYDYLYFGFHSQHNKLAWKRTASMTQTTYDLPSGYKPLRSPLDGIALRIVRESNNYYLQARLDTPTYPLNDPDPQYLLLEGAEEPLLTPNPSPMDPLTQYCTLDVLTHSEQPKAIGMIVKTWNPILCDTAFLNFEVLDGTNRSNLLKFAIEEWSYAEPNGTPSPDVFRTLPTDRLRFHKPYGGTWWVEDALSRGRIDLVTPYTVLTDGNRNWPSGDTARYENLMSFDHTSSIDRAPKIITRAPSSNFAFATSAKINRSAVSPWTAGSAAGMTMWGKANSFTIDNIVLSENAIRKQRPPPPFSNNDNTPAYKIAFIIVAPQLSDITNTYAAENINIVRQYCEPGFANLTLNRRKLNSTLQV